MLTTTIRSFSRTIVDRSGKAATNQSFTLLTDTLFFKLKQKIHEKKKLIYNLQSLESGCLKMANAKALQRVAKCSYKAPNLKKICKHTKEFLLLKNSNK